MQIFIDVQEIWLTETLTWYFSDRASWIDYTLITNLMHWLLFFHKILFYSTCFEPQVLIFRRIQLYTVSVLTQAVYRQATRNTHREWQYHMLHVYNCILLKMSTWCLKHVEENIISWINNNKCINLVINIVKNIVYSIVCFEDKRMYNLMMTDIVAETCRC